MLVYLDRDQCSLFGLDYLSPTQSPDGDLVRFFCAADTLLASKKKGYDKETTDLLKPLGGKTAILHPAPAEGPGWYTLLGWLSGRGVYTALDGTTHSL